MFEKSLMITCLKLNERQGLSGLVQMPMGCGEQNMILFTPNIYVVQYLESTGQLEPAIKKKAVGYMKSGMIT